MALEHGGRLVAAAERFAIPPGEWLDLSTGINPTGWPVPALPAACWARLPECGDGLQAAASAYYGAPGLLPVAGSQAAIQTLPLLRAPGRVGVPAPGYAEHARAWRQASHQVVPLNGIEAMETALGGLEVLVVINPNNPTGQAIDRERLLAWHTRLAARGGWLIVDEAFVDTTPERSLAAETDRPGLIVLRSLGKFFGLAGVRAGFVLAEPGLLQRLDDRLGPWAVAGPSREVARRALLDRHWQTTARHTLHQAGQRLAELLHCHGLAPSGGTPLFQWVRHARAAELWQRAARRGVLLRHFDEPASLRFGLPGAPVQWQRLEATLTEIGQ